jgi:proton-coupled amino acid transporter
LLLFVLPFLSFLYCYPIDYTTQSFFRQIVLWGIFLTYFATGSCYAVIVAENFNYVAFNYITPFDKRITIGLLFLPFLLIAYVPNLKYLAPVSMVANVCMAVGLGITCYYLLVDIPSISERPAIANLSTLPVGISVVIFAIEAIGVVRRLHSFTNLFLISTVR